MGLHEASSTAMVEWSVPPSTLWLVSCLATGAALGLSWRPFNLWPLGFVALAPVLYLLDREPPVTRRLRTALLYGVVTGAATDGVMMTWLLSTIHHHGGVPWWQAALIFLGYSALTSGNWVIFFWLALGRRDRWSWMAAWAVAQTLGYELFPHLGLNHVTGDLAFVQIAGLLGVAGGSLVWFWVNLGFYELLRGRPTRLALGGVLAFVLAHAYGGVVLSAPPTPPTARVAVVQPGPQLGRSLPSMLEQSAVAPGAAADFVVWPEGSLPDDWSADRQGLQAALERLGLPVLVQFRERAEGRLFSTIALLDRSGELVRSYRKIKLTPVGESVPLLADWLPWRPAFSAGQEPKLLPTPVGPVLPLLCYEAIVPDFAWWSFCATGGQAVLLVNSASDAWSYRSGAGPQDLDLARMRAIELGIPMVRAARTGPSAAIDPQGRIQGETPLDRRDFAVYPVAPRPGSTLFAALGPLPYYLVVLLSAWKVLRRLETP